MNDPGKKLTLVALGTALGLFFAAIIWLSWSIFWPAPKSLSPSDVLELTQMLDEGQGTYVYDPYTQYRFKVNFRSVRQGSITLPHVTNSSGLLGSEEIDARPQALRVLFLGDSITYGDGIAFENIFVSQMQKLAPPEYLLANSACPGWNTRQQLAYFRHYAINQDWDGIVIAFCLNDLAEFCWKRTASGKFDMLMNEENTTLVKHRLSELRDQFLQSEQTRPLASHDDATLMAWDGERWPKFLNELLLPFLQEIKPAVIICALPSRYQMEALRLGTKRDLALYPQRQLAQFCQQNDVPFLNAIEAFDITDKNQVEEIFRPNDYLHYSNVGHQRIADFLWPHVYTVMENIKPVEK